MLALTFGQSAVYSIVRLAYLNARGPIGEQTTTLNPPRSDLEVFDLIYNVLGSVFDLASVALVAYLLWQTARPHLARLGIDARHPLRDSLWGAGLAVVIGVGGIGVYLGGRALGITTEVNPQGLDDHWWTVPVLLLSAFRSGATEEIVVVGYLFARLRDLGWCDWPIILATAALRGSYHLYQGWGSFVGNFVMGVIFGWIYSRTGRVLPFVIAHVIIDAAIFVGFPWAAATFPDLLGVSSN